MNLRLAMSSGACAVAMLVSGHAAAATGTTRTSPTGATTGPGCVEIVALLDAQTTLGMAMFSDDAATVEAGLSELSDLAAAASGAAPDEISEEVATVTATIDATVAALEGVDLGDTDAVLGGPRGDGERGDRRGLSGRVAVGYRQLRVRPGRPVR